MLQSLLRLEDFCLGGTCQGAARAGGSMRTSHNVSPIHTEDKAKTSTYTGSIQDMGYLQNSSEVHPGDWKQAL